MLSKKSEEYEKKINELERKIKDLEAKLQEKDRLIKEEKLRNDNLNKIIKEFGIKSNDAAKTNYLKELENEIKLFKSYYKFSSNEKLISIKFVSGNQDVNFTIIAKNTDLFSNIEKQLYDNYPRYIDSENYYLCNGNRINKHRTLEENKIKNNDTLLLRIYNFDWSIFKLF